LGGDVLGGATLSRFYSTHVFFLPGIIYVLIALHLFLVLRNGISDRPKRGKLVTIPGYKKEYEELVKKEGEPFWPNAAWRDIVFGSCVVLVIVGLAIVYGAPALGRPPDPTLIDAQPRPDWYLLWYFAVLSLLPHGTEDFVIVFAPLLFGAMIFFLPLISNRGERHPARRPWAIVIVISAVTIIASFTVAGYQSNWSPDFHPKPIPDSVVASHDRQVQTGAHLFFDKACINCHQIAGQGGKRGPDLSLIAERLSRDDLIIRIVNGGTNMPPFGPSLKAEELSAIVSFLETRKR
jgi:ubiquinol-cytochrome c reductase cytochrome b subunit